MIRHVLLSGAIVATAIVGSSGAYAVEKEDAAQYSRARELMNEERYEKALSILEKVTAASDGAKAEHAGEALFMKGVCQVNLLDRKKAAATFKKFLDENPDASERLRVGAEYQIAELELLTDGSLLDVQGRMDFTRRRLALEDSGDDTQGQQTKIVSMLDTLIAQAEQKEKGS
jgi:tetratricopeptide (TPR) repeat protein